MSKKVDILKSKIQRKMNNKPSSNKKPVTTKDGKVVKRKISAKKTIKTLILLFFILCICGLFLLGLFFGYIVIKSPQFDANSLYNKQASVLLDKEGNEITRIGTEIRDIISYDQLPETLVDAIVATEDSRFFQHNGFDLPRFMVAAGKQLLGNSSAGGASTLTMQISKNKLTSTEDGGIKGIIRKFTDIYLSVFKIEKNYTKQEIIEFYVNANYLGAGVNGVEDASKAYFSKSAKDLNVAEAAMIAGLFNAPNYYDPYKNPKGCEQRRETVLYLMKRHKYITDEEYNIAMKMTVDKILNPTPNVKENDYQGFINTVVEDVIKKTNNNPYEVPMKIYTTMIPSQQQHMDKLMNGELPGYKWQNDKVQGAVAVLSTEDGSITAVGAGRNRTDRSYNYATMLRNQIGSTAKPLYDYALGIEHKDWGTGQIFVDEPWGYSDGTQIKNWDLKYEGFVNMRTALVESRNIPALKAFQQVENKTRVEWINSLGLHPEISDGIIHEAHALGGYNGESPLSMAAAYNAFANKGYYIEPYSFTKIEYLQTGETYEYKYSMKKVMSEETAYIMTNLLISVAKGTGFAGYNVNGVTYAGKSGTTNLDQATIEAWHLPSKAVADIWAVGFTDKFTIAAWYGYDEMSSEYYNTFGSGQNYRIFCAAAKGVFTEQSNFVQPDGVVTVNLERGCYEPCLPSEFTPSNYITTEYYKKGTEPTTVSDRFAKLPDVSGLTQKGNQLTWNAVETPNAINQTYLNKYFGEAYKNADWAQNAASGRYSENLSELGTIQYKIYEKSGGSLTPVDTTTSNSWTIKSRTTNPTFVVKVSYSNFTANMSDGKEVSTSGISGNTDANFNVELNNTGVGYKIENNTIILSGDSATIEDDIVKSPSPATVTLNGQKSITVKVGDPDVELKVTYNNQTKTFKYPIKKG